MIKKLFRFLRKIIFAFIVLYSYNLLSSSINLMIPINYITVLAITILGMPALFVLIFIAFLAF